MIPKFFILVAIGIFGFAGTIFAQESEEETIKDICEEGKVLVDGICLDRSPIDSSDFRKLQTGESISNNEVAIILETLGAGLIALFIVIYAIKKRRKNDHS